MTFSNSLHLVVWLEIWLLGADPELYQNCKIKFAYELEISADNLLCDDQDGTLFQGQQLSFYNFNRCVIILSFSAFVFSTGLCNVGFRCFF